MAVPLLGSSTVADFGFKHREASFHMAGVALRDIQQVSSHVDNRFLWQFGSFSEDELRGKRSTSDVECCMLVVNPMVKAARSGHGVQIFWHSGHSVICDEN